jgi:1-deoxy-D-xylulose-5-phosphate reductoisomerase
LRAEGSLPVVLNAANEVAVDAFLDGKLGFTSIARVIEKTMDAHETIPVDAVGVVRRVDAWARDYARQVARGLELTV